MGGFGEGGREKGGEREREEEKKKKNLFKDLPLSLLELICSRVVEGGEAGVWGPGPGKLAVSLCHKNKLRSEGRAHTNIVPSENISTTSDA